MLQILTQCDKIYRNSNCCHRDPIRSCDCSVCLKEGFYGGRDTYSCIKKLCNYTMNYGPAFVSEIYHFLDFSKILEQNFNSRTIKVLSLGCGFGPDFIAIDKYIRVNSLNINLQYHGIDIQEFWANTNNWAPPNKFSVQDVLAGFSVVGYDILFINKLFSTLKSNNSEKNFLNILEPQIKTSLDNGSFVIFNDINHKDRGRDLFHIKISKLMKTSGRYFYNIEKAYTGDYIEIPNTHIFAKFRQI